MSMPIKILGHAAEIAQGGKKQMGLFWKQWFNDMLLELHKALTPPKAIISCNLTAQDISDYFDANGLGVRGSPYQWWAICNGNAHDINGTTVTTPDLATNSPFVRHSNTAAGGTGGDETSGAPSTASTGGSSATTSSASGYAVCVTGSGASVATKNHTHTVNSHSHTIAHTHEVTAPYYELVFLMRVA